MSKNKSTKLNEVDIAEFKEYWESLKLIKTISASEDYNKIYHKTRRYILRVLSDGMLDIDFKTIRHVLNVNEIKSLIKSKFNIDLKKPNLYHHIEELEKFNLVKVVKKKPSGKKTTSYIGRTSKLVLFENKDHKTKINPNLSVLKDQNFVNFIDSLDSSKEVNFQQEIEQTNVSIKHFNQEFLDWISLNEEKVVQFDFNLNEFFALFEFLKNFDEQTISTLMKIKKALKIS